MTIENKEWNGEGLPPVGCEVLFNDKVEVEVAAHYKRLIVCVEPANGVYLPNVFMSKLCDITPIKSKQDIEREAEIDKMLALDPFTGIAALTSRTDFCHKLIDAGYRNNGEEVGDKVSVTALHEYIRGLGDIRYNLAENLMEDFKIYQRNP